MLKRAKLESRAPGPIASFAATDLLPHHAQLKIVELIFGCDLLLAVHMTYLAI